LQSGAIKPDFRQTIFFSVGILTRIFEGVIDGYPVEEAGIFLHQPHCLGVQLDIDYTSAIVDSIIYFGYLFFPHRSYPLEYSFTTKVL
jgi:hypothetical protein